MQKHIIQTYSKASAWSRLSPVHPLWLCAAHRWEVFPIYITHYVTVVCVASWVSFRRSIDVAAIITCPSFTPTPALPL